jgi:hypothetical protein
VKHTTRRGGWVLPVLFLFCAAMAMAQSPSHAEPPSHALMEGEELTYNVRYAFLDLGQIRIKITAKEHKAGATTYAGIAYIDSYKNVPLVDLHAIFQSMIDSTVFSRGFTGKMKQDNAWDFSRYQFNYDRRMVAMEMGQKDTVIAKRDTLWIDGPCQDGLSLFFFARHHLFDGKDANVSAIVTEKKVNTFIRFDKRRDEVEIDAVDYPIDVVGFEGNAEFVGIFGLTGGFDGWFSNDDARVPIIAHMKVILGSVTIELMSWKRPGWTPPRAKD